MTLLPHRPLPDTALRTRHFLGRVLALILALILAFARATVAADAHPGHDPTPSDAGRVHGVTYAPNHNWAYPVLGGWVARGALAEAIDEDFALLRRYFTHIRTLSATVFGIELVPIAQRHGLKVYVGVPVLLPQWNTTVELRRAVAAAVEYPETVEGLIVGESEVANADVPFNDPLVLDRVREIRHVQQTLGIKTDIKVGVLVHPQWTSKLSREGITEIIGLLDIFILGMYYNTVSSGLSDDEWRNFVRALPASTQVFVDGLFYPRRFQKTNESTMGFAAWKPPKTHPQPLKLIKFWDSAFEVQSDDKSLGPYTHRVGAFTSDRYRQLATIPPPLDPNDDPAKLPAVPLTATCYTGMYYLVLADYEDEVRLCMMNGFNFRTPTKFDEISLEAACQNDWCHVVIQALSAIPEPAKCPFTEPMSRETMYSMILEPFKADCKRNVTRAPEVRDLGNNSAACKTRLRGVWNVTEDRESCEVLSGVSIANAVMRLIQHPRDPAYRLSTDDFSKMCYEQSCEYIMLQLANPARQRITCYWWSEARVRRELVSQHITMPYYDTCYDPTLLSATYFDTTYRVRKKNKTTPTPRTQIASPLQHSDDDNSRHTELVDVTPSGVLTDGDDVVDEVESRKRRRRSTTEMPLDLEDPLHTSSSDPVALPSRHDTTKPLLSWPSKLPDTTSPGTPRPTQPESHAQRSVSPHRVSPIVICGVATVILCFVCALARRAPCAHVDDSYRQIVVLEGISQQAAPPRPTWADDELAALFIPSHCIRDIRLLGGGGQALVYMVEINMSLGKKWTHRSQELQLLASKRLPRNLVQSGPTALHDFVTEIKIQAALDHPNIVKLIGASWTNGHDLQALFELMPHGDLCSLLCCTERTDWTMTKWQLALDVIEALVYVHSRSPPLLHRDVKSRNVLLDSPPAPSSLLRAKLTDFGVARWQSKNETMSTGVGTSRWLAPEVILGGGDYDQSCDVYSFGVLLCELDTHALPFGERETASGDLLPDITLLQLVVTGAITPTFTAHCPPELLALARDCLAFDPSSRPSAREVASRLHMMATRFLELC